jgi:hypothetical protein
MVQKVSFRVDGWGKDDIKYLEGFGTYKEILRFIQSWWKMYGNYYRLGCKTTMNGNETYATILSVKFI